MFHLIYHVEKMIMKSWTMKFWGKQFSDKAIFQCKKLNWLDFNFQAITKNIGPYRREYDIHKP
jgi:hypothetical protein